MLFLEQPQKAVIVQPQINRKISDFKFCIKNSLFQNYYSWKFYLNYLF